MKKIFTLIAFYSFLSNTALAQTPSYCSTLTVSILPFMSSRYDETLTLISTGAGTAGCPNGYPVWEKFTGFDRYRIYRDPADCNKWILLHTPCCGAMAYIKATATTATPTDNPPLTSAAWVQVTFPGVAWYVTGCNTPLPVRLLSFEGEANQNVVMLRWATAEESNNKGFVIERSQNGVVFEALGSRDGRGSSKTQQSYEFEDSSAKPGINYYRLKQIDFDGTFQYSALVAVINDFGLGVFPNPTQSAITLTLPQDFRATIKIINASGSTMKETTLSEMSKTLNIGNYAMGEYWVLFSDEAGRKLKSVKVVKQ